MMREELEKLIAEATPGDLSTAELSREEVIECPVCGGDGEVDAVDYCNFDHKALGVQFYGIGKEFGAHEKLWSYFMNNAPAILEALTERASMAAEIERLRAAIKIQASAVRTLQANEDTEINILRKQKREWHQAVSSLDSEREVNEILTAENERLRGLVEELADDLEVEVQDRWGYDERLAHKLKRDMDVIVRARAALKLARENADAR